MSIRLLGRFATLLKADAHGVLESLEERSLLLKQYVREAEIELNQKRARLEALRQEEQRLREEVGRRDEEVRALDEDVRLALRGEKDDLARFAIRRLLPRRSAVTALRAALEERVRQAGALAERLQDQEAQFEALRTRVRAELARGAEAVDLPGWMAEPVVADEEVELELMRRRRATEGGV